MNSIRLLGRVSGHPIYYCTRKAMDIVRIKLVTKDKAGKLHTHHCLAYGPAAIDLHTHLATDNRLMVKGELLYRDRISNGRTSTIPYILVRQYTYLDGPVKMVNPASDPPPCAVVKLS